MDAKKVFLYAGQGSQRVGMGEDFYAESEIYRKAVDGLELGEDIINLMREGPEDKLSDTAYTQVCMAAFAVGVTAMLRENGIAPSASCGLSLGEYGALYAAGVFDARTYAELLRYRGRVMAEAAIGVDSCMSAVIGMDSNVIKEACEKVTQGYVTVANYNCPGQTVICGNKDAVEQAEDILAGEGCKRCIRLKVSGPFHTKYMKPAGEKLEIYLQSIKLGRPVIPVLSNTTGNYYSESDDICGLLVKQVQSSVHLEDNLRKLLLAGYREFIEIGPGKTMAGFLKRTAKVLNMEISVNSIDCISDFRKVVAI